MLNAVRNYLFDRKMERATGFKGSELVRLYSRLMQLWYVSEKLCYLNNKVHALQCKPGYFYARSTETIITITPRGNEYLIHEKLGDDFQLVLEFSPSKRTFQVFERDGAKWKALVTDLLKYNHELKPNTDPLGGDAIYG